MAVPAVRAGVCDGDISSCICQRRRQFSWREVCQHVLARHVFVRVLSCSMLLTFLLLTCLLTAIPLPPLSSCHNSCALCRFVPRTNPTFLRRRSLFMNSWLHLTSSVMVSDSKEPPFCAHLLRNTSIFLWPLWSDSTHGSLLAACIPVSL